MCLLTLMIYFVIAIVFVLLLAVVYAKLTCGICKCSKHLVGKVVLVTGANTGIGYETARDLAERGARVLLACRSEARGAAARDRIVAATGNTDVHFRPLDLTSLRSVRSLAENILATEKRLDILINNAGMFGGGKSSTVDGLQICMQVNHFGPFLLTSLLLPLLRSSAPSRIVNVSSGAHWFSKIDFNNLNFEKETDETISNFKVYCCTKLCNILMTVELERRLKGTGVTAYSLHPGMVQTEITRNMAGFLFYFIFKPIQNLLSKNAWEGAQTQIYLAVAPEVVKMSGKYFSDCRLEWSSPSCRNKELAKKLWDASEKIVGIK